MKKLILIFVAILLTGCATKYSFYKSYEIDGVKYETKLDINSKREFKNFYAEGNSKTGDFKVVAEEVKTQANPFEDMAVDTFSKLLEKVDIK